MAESRERAKALVMAGSVYADGARVDKPGVKLPDSVSVEVRGKTCEYVSRGGLKLKRALDVFGIDVRGLACIDCGASTGGFTDCLLQNGAAAVTAVDVGYGQLAWKLREDPRVTVMERVNVRLLKPDAFPARFDLATLDLSFISLRLVLPVVRELITEGGRAVCLVKPQFEAGRESVGKKGVVRDPKVHEAVLREFLRYSAESGFTVLGLDWSPVKGPEGNIEYLGYLRNGPDTADGINPAAVVEAAHAALDANG